MELIEGTDIWTDGVVKYRRNDSGEMLIYEEPLVDTDEENQDASN